MKGLMLAEEQVRYIIGIIIAIVIVFCLWWFFFHREADQQAEQSMADFARAVDTCCATGRSVAKIQLPQKYQPADIWNQFLQGQSTPGGLGRDPYFLMYWEKFPPESPYENNTFGMFGNLIAPWSEDLPWNSNMMMTLAFDFVGIGLDATGIKTGVKEAVGQGISGNNAEMLKDAINRIETGTGFVDKMKNVVVKLKEGKYALQWAGKEAIILTSETAVYEVACMYIFDKNVGECLPYAFGGAIGTEILRQVVLPKLGQKINEKITEIIGERQVKVSYEKLSEGLGEYADDVADDSEKMLKKGATTASGDTIPGVEFKDIDMTTKVGKLKEDTEIYKALKQNAEMIHETTGSWPESLPGDSNFKFVTKVVDGEEVLTDITYDIGSWRQSIKNKFLSPMNWIAKNIDEGVMGNTLGTPETINQISQAGKLLVREYEELGYEDSGKYIFDLMKKAGQKPNNVDEAVDVFRGLIYNFEKESERGSLLVFEKGTKLAKLIETCPGDCVNDLYGYIKYASMDKDEAILFTHLLKTTRFRTKEVVKGVLESYSQGTLGYMVLRYQDLYTPLGATYWDKQMSYSMGSYAGEFCDDEEMCLQMGFFVRRYPLPESCKTRNIKNIVLERGSVVAGNPRFYLVSPCYAEIELRRDDDTIYVKPLMCPDKKDALGNSINNYCYATGGMVNAYIGAETGAMVGNCVAAVLCSAAITAGTAGGGSITIGDAILTCLGIKNPGICQVVGSVTRTLIDYGREAYLKYPDVYSPPLAKWMMDNTCNQQDPNCGFCYK